MPLPVKEKSTSGGSEWEAIDLYRFFAFVFGPPNQERFQWLSQPGLADSLARLWERVECPGEFPGTDSFADFGEYESTYIGLFDVGAPEPPVPLVESAHYKALPAQQTALENVAFYEVLGLQPDSSRFAPDHLVAQLEFLAAVGYARRNTPKEENRQNLQRLERDFLERHLLNWLPAACEKLARYQPPAFSVLLPLLLAHASQQLHQLKHSLSNA